MSTLPAPPVSPAELSVPAPRLSSRGWTWISALAILLLAVGHYVARDGGHSMEAGGDILPHALFRRLSYLPIAALAVMHGVKGGGLAAGGATFLYMPHAFLAPALSRWTGLSIAADPSPLVEKVSEIVLYFALALVVGFAVDRARLARARLIRVSQQLDEVTDTLRRAERLSALGELTAGIAHEVRNPLTALRTTAELLVEAYPEGHARHRMAILHLEEIDRLDGVVRRFLSFSSPRLPERKVRDLREIVARVNHLLQSTAKQKSIAIEIEGGPPRHAEVDAEQIVHVLLNLGLNAIQVSPAGGKVRFAVEDQGEELVVCVLDEGPGVDPAIGERIFDPCVTTRPGGSGLGLSVASRIAEAHGGRLVFRAREGGGARFELRLPREASGS